MIARKQIDARREIDGIDWIAALRPEAIRKPVAGGVVQMGLFDEHNLFELRHPDIPGERLVACRNPELTRPGGAEAPGSSRSDCPGIGESPTDG